MNCKKQFYLCQNAYHIFTVFNTNKQFCANNMFNNEKFANYNIFINNLATRLTDDDMGTVTNEIWKVRASFYNLGMNLKIDAGTLDVAKREGDDGEALNLVIKTWLKKNKPKPTWKALIQALRQKNMKAETLAEKIATKYCPDEITTDSEEGMLTST